MVATVPNDAWWTTALFGFGDRIVPDVGDGFPPTAAPDSRIDAQYRGFAEGRDCGVGFLDALTPGQRPVFVRKAKIGQPRCDPSGDGQDWSEDLRRGCPLGSMLCMRLPGNKWLEEKYKTKRKLHLGLDLVSGEIACADLTKDDGGDPTARPDLLDQVEGPVDLFLADGAYDAEPTSDLLAARFGSMIDVTIPPPRNATLSPNAATNRTARECHIVEIAAHGRMAWQKATGYNQRNRGETLMGRWKTGVGPKLKARSFENQKTEAGIGVRALNRMTGLGGPPFERTA